MPRKARIVAPGALHHIIARGIARKKVFDDNADSDDHNEEVIDGRPVMRSKGVMLKNHFKRWYFHVKKSQRIVDATELAEKLQA